MDWLSLTLKGNIPETTELSCLLQIFQISGKLSNLHFKHSGNAIQTSFEISHWTVAHHDIGCIDTFSVDFRGQKTLLILSVNVPLHCKKFCTARLVRWEFLIDKIAEKAKKICKYVPAVVQLNVLLSECLQQMCGQSYFSSLSGTVIYPLAGQQMGPHSQWALQCGQFYVNL